jgi:hypothetical protein
VAEVQKQIEASGPTVTLDLEDVTLVDVQVVRFLGACETRGIDASQRLSVLSATGSRGSEA